MHCTAFVVEGTRPPIGCMAPVIDPDVSLVTFDVLVEVLVAVVTVRSNVIGST